jgi:tRNA pseudouridine65 synthase
MRLDELHRSRDLLVLDKPADVSMFADRAGAPCLWDALKDALGAEGRRPYAVHRLDKGTSGVLLVALTPARQAELTRAFAARAVRKFYSSTQRKVAEIAKKTNDQKLCALCSFAFEASTKAG